MPPPRPRWEAKFKKAPAARSTNSSRTTAKESNEIAATSACIPLELQQLLLNIFKNAFSDRFLADIKPLVQEVKGHLFNRDFATAFGKDEYLEAYAARWSASRALGYADLFWSMRELLWLRQDTHDTNSEPAKRKVVCLGGGAGAEIVALGAIQDLFKSAHTTTPIVDVHSIDVADWTVVADSLAKHVTMAPPLSKYASAAVQAANAPLVDHSVFESSFHRFDILTAEFENLRPLLDGASLVTLMFTLNELYSTSLSLTQKFLLNMTAALPTGAMLLVVDSPGSYSTVSLNATEKRYPMQWLLDHTLIESLVGRKKEDEPDRLPKWEKMEENESRWFRLDDSLKYPIDLENMRMQLHLYRRL